MKIVFVCEWDPLTGGAFTVANDLINTMMKLKYSLDLNGVRKYLLKISFISSSVFKVSFDNRMFSSFCLLPTL